MKGVHICAQLAGGVTIEHGLQSRRADIADRQLCVVIHTTQRHVTVPKDTHVEERVFAESFDLLLSWIKLIIIADPGIGESKGAPEGNPQAPLQQIFAMRAIAGGA